MTRVGSQSHSKKKNVTNPAYRCSTFIENTAVVTVKAI